MTTAKNAVFIVLQLENYYLVGGIDFRLLLRGGGNKNKLLGEVY